MKYNIVGNFNLWGWICLKDKLNGIIVEYEMNENLITEMTIQTKLDEATVEEVIKNYGAVIVLKQ